MKNGFYFIVVVLLVAELFKIFDLLNLEDLQHHKVDTKWIKFTKSEISLKTFSV